MVQGVLNIVTITIQKNITMKKILLTLFALSLSASWLPAKEINFPDSSNWMISFDVKAFHDSRMGKFIMGKINEDPNVNQ